METIWQWESALALNIVDNDKQETGKDVVATALSIDLVKFCPPI